MMRLPTARTAALRAPRRTFPAEEHECGDAAQAGEDHQREGARGEPVEEVVGVGCQDEDARQRHGTSCDAGRSSPPEGPPWLRPTAGGRPWSGRSTRGTQPRPRRACRPGSTWGSPAVPGVTSDPAGRDQPGRDTTDHGTEAVGHQDPRKRRRQHRSCVGPGCGRQPLKREAEAPEHDPEGGEVRGTKRGDELSRHRPRESRSRAPRTEDQPHVVGLPHRADRMVDDLAGTRRAGCRRRSGPRSRHRSRRPRTPRYTVTATNNTTPRR